MQQPKQTVYGLFLKFFKTRNHNGKVLDVWKTIPNETKQLWKERYNSNAELTLDALFVEYTGNAQWIVHDEPELKEESPLIKTRADYPTIKRGRKVAPSS